MKKRFSAKPLFTGSIRDTAVCETEVLAEASKLFFKPIGKKKHPSPEKNEGSTDNMRP